MSAHSTRRMCRVVSRQAKWNFDFTVPYKLSFYYLLLLLLHSTTSDNCSGTVCQCQNGRIACSQRLWPTTNGHAQPWFAVYGLHLRNTCNYMDYYSFTDPKGMEGWVGLVGWPIMDTSPTKWSHVNHRSGVASQPKTDVLTAEPCRQLGYIMPLKVLV